MTRSWTIGMSSLLVLLAVLAAPPKAAKPTPPKPPAISLAGLLGGSVIVPLAQFSEGRWVSTWPAAGEDVKQEIRSEKDIPRTWYPSGSVPRKWYAWTGARRPTSIEIGSPRSAEGHCALVWGFSTSLKSTDHETTALATSVASGVRPFSRVALTKAVRALIRAELARATSPTKTASGVSGNLPTPEIEVTCASISDTGTELCGFDASVRHKGPSQMDTTECDRITVVQGWVLATGSKKRVLSRRVTETDCDGRELRTQYPELVVGAGDRVFVIVKEHGYEDESFHIFEFQNNQLRPVLEVPGTGC